MAPDSLVLLLSLAEPTNRDYRDYVLASLRMIGRIDSLAEHKCGFFYYSARLRRRLCLLCIRHISALSVCIVYKRVFADHTSLQSIRLSRCSAYFQVGLTNSNFPLPARIASFRLPRHAHHCRSLAVADLVYRFKPISEAKNHIIHLFL